MINTTLDNRFRIEDLLAKGVTGGVYLGRDLDDNRQVAIKLLFMPSNADPNFGSRFRREVQVLRELNHPNIVRVIKAGKTTDGILYYAMEYVVGKNLQRLVEAHAWLAVDRVGHLLEQIAGALDVAHGRNIIHRDVNPTNILVETDAHGRERAKLIDFGLAKSLDSSDTYLGGGPATGRLRLGVAAYLAPEQLAGKPTTRLSDIHSLSVTLYLALTGKHPFLRENEISTIGAILEEPPPMFLAANPDCFVPRSVEDVVRRGLSKRPKDRPASAGELARRFVAAWNAATPAERTPFTTPRRPSSGASSHGSGMFSRVGATPVPSASGNRPPGPPPADSARLAIPRPPASASSGRYSPSATAVREKLKSAGELARAFATPPKPTVRRPFQISARAVIWLLIMLGLPVLAYIAYGITYLLLT